MPNLSHEAKKFSLHVIETLRESGFIAYWAGGCVRDRLLGRPVVEFDVATDATPEEVRRLFRRTVAVGASFGVVNVLGPPGISVEVATFRTDSSYSDGRRPDAISFASPEEDAHRRDFTINGMFLDPTTEQILDFVDGQRDIERRLVRAIGEPRDRFREDKLRMLRAVRFAATLGFDIDSATLEAIQEMARELTVISAERILAELRKMFQPPTRVGALQWLRVSRLFDVIFPELADKLDSSEAWQMTQGILGFWDGNVSISLAMAGLVTCLPDAQVGAVVDQIFRRLKSSVNERETSVWLVTNRHALEHLDGWKASRWKRLLVHPKRNELLDLFEAQERLTQADASRTRELRHRLSQWMDEGSFNPKMLLTGDDLTALGYAPGRQFKEILDAVRDRQLDGEITDTASALQWVRENWPLGASG